MSGFLFHVRMRRGGSLEVGLSVDFCSTDLNRPCSMERTHK